MILTLIVYYIIVTFILYYIHKDDVYNSILESIRKDNGDYHPVFLNPYDIRTMLSIIFLIIPFSLYVLLLIGYIQKLKNPKL